MQERLRTKGAAVNGGVPAPAAPATPAIDGLQCSESEISLQMVGQWAEHAGTSVVANPLDGRTGEFLDLLSDLGDKCVGVVAIGVSLEPDLPACVLA
jgi:hypothetical protein